MLCEWDQVVTSKVDKVKRTFQNYQIKIELIILETHNNHNNNNDDNKDDINNAI